jgi:site-specific DNA recombinase
MKAVLYVRVSTKEQVGNTSLASQDAACRKWCDEHELEIDRVFVEAGESAKSENRTEFQRMFRYLDTVGSRISHVVVWKFDRFSRDSADTAIYSRKLRLLGIDLVSVTEPIDSSSLMGRAMIGVAGVFNQLENETRADRSLISMKATFMTGRWTWSAPVGYVSENKSLKVDPERGLLVAQLFDMVASGQVKKATALAQATRLGLLTVRGRPLTQQTVNHLLRNELYCGRMFAKKWGLRAKGNFQPLISEELFDRVQAVLDGRALVTTPHKRQNPNFPLKGSLLCAVCGSVVTGSTSAGKMAARYEKDDPARARYLYRNYCCHKSAGHFSMRAEKVEAALQSLLGKLEPDAVRMKAVTEIFRSIWNERREVQQIELRSMTARLKALEAKESKLIDALTEGTLTKSAFKRAIEPLTSEMEGLRQELASQKFDELDIDEALGYLQSMFWNLLTLWESNNLEQRSSLLKLLFPDGLVMNSGVLEPKSTNSFFASLSDESVALEALVSPMGFEPMLSP